MCDSNAIASLEALTSKYDEEKKILDAALKSGDHGHTNCAVATEDVQNLMDKLYQLDIVGPKIKEATNIQATLQHTELVQNNEYVHKAVLGEPAKDENKSKPHPKGIRNHCLFLLDFYCVL